MLAPQLLDLPSLLSACHASLRQVHFRVCVEKPLKSRLSYFLVVTATQVMLCRCLDSCAHSSEICVFAVVPTSLIWRPSLQVGSPAWDLQGMIPCMGPIIGYESWCQKTKTPWATDGKNRMIHGQWRRSCGGPGVLTLSFSVSVGVQLDTDPSTFLPPCCYIACNAQLVSVLTAVALCHVHQGILDSLDVRRLAEEFASCMVGHSQWIIWKLDINKTIERVF